MEHLIRPIIESVIIIIAIVIMGYALYQNNKLLKAIEGSKVEPVWRGARLLVILLLLFFFFFATIRLLATIDSTSDSFTLPEFLFNLGLGTTHNLMMNSSFLLTSLLLSVIFRVDTKAYSALFELIREK